MVRPRPPAAAWIPAGVSMILSLATIGTGPGWQDSGYFLAAIRDLSVLYPHGFVLYQGLCRPWSALLSPVLGFTLAVHLFSAVCAAGAAAFLGLAGRETLRRAGIPRPELPAAAAASLWASGYCFWNAALLAKPYALLYLALAALAWTVLRAERPGHVAQALVLAALAWLAHPSGVLVLPVLAAYAWHRRALWSSCGAGTIALNLMLCLALATLPLGALPWLASRPQLADLGDPRGWSELWYFVRGGRFVDDDFAFGWDAPRVAQSLRVLAEEHLLAWGFVALGAAALWRACRPEALLIAGLAATLGGVTLFFRLEGQLDHWWAAACLPLCPAAAAGIARLRDAAPRSSAAVTLAAGLLAVGFNGPDLLQRGFTPPLDWARAVLASADPGGLLVLATDDSASGVRYLQAVRGERPDLVVVSTGPAGLPWYDRRMADFGGLDLPDWEAYWRSRPGLPVDRFETTALADLNARTGRSVYCETEPARDFLSPGLEVRRSGQLWRVAPVGTPPPDPGRWVAPGVLDRMAASVRRARGTTLRRTAAGLQMSWEPYELRALDSLAAARIDLAAIQSAADPAAAAATLLHARGVRPSLDLRADFLALLADVLHRGHALAAHRGVFDRGWTAASSPDARAVAALALALIEGAGTGSRSRLQEASGLPGLSPAWRQRLLAALAGS